MNRATSHIIEGIAISCGLVAMLILGGSLFALSGYIDGKIQPVIENFAIEDWEYEPSEKESGILRGSFFKARDCTFKGIQIYATDTLDATDDERRVERLRWRFYDQPDMQISSRPKGQQQFGPWEIFRPLGQNMRFIHIKVFHECFNIFSREQELVILEWPPK